MQSKTLVFVTAVLLTQASLALGQTSGSGSTGSNSSTTGAPEGSTAAPQNSVPSGTGPTPAPTPGQSFTFHRILARREQVQAIPAFRAAPAQRRRPHRVNPARCRADPAARPDQHNGPAVERPQRPASARPLAARRELRRIRTCREPGRQTGPASLGGGPARPAASARPRPGQSFALCMKTNEGGDSIRLSPLLRLHER